MNTSISKRQGIICFFSLTAIFLFSRYLTFKGFNGTDDLHYALLSANLLKGDYNPFQINDIFSGRILLIGWQALIYFVFGITTFSTQVGTLVVTIICGYLTIFKLARFSDINHILIASSLFYFNPVLGEATLGVMPDVFIMLTGILILIWWRDISALQNRNKIILKSILCGITIFLAMFFKENALIFIPFLFFISFLAGRKKLILASILISIIFLICVLFAGLMYYQFTGDFFFRAHQIIASDYPNSCNFAMFPVKDKIIRLTYGVWVRFIILSFYPAVLAAGMILLRILFDKKFRWNENKMIIPFTLLFLLGLYMPFSLNGYQPLCFEPSHFIFLLPPGVIVCVYFLEKAWNDKWIMWLFIFASAIMLLVSLTNSVQKWYWLVYSVLLLYFINQKFNPLPVVYKSRFIVLAFVLWLFMPFRLFIDSSNWYQDMQETSAEVKEKYYYFPDHDNMIHWRLIHDFDTTIHSFI